MEENNGKFKLDKNRVLNDVIIATLTIVISGVILWCLLTVVRSDMGTSDRVFSNSSSGENAKYLDRINEAINQLKKKYIDIDDVDMDELVDGAISGIASATGDPYTRYLTSDEFNELLTSGTETFSGIGVHLIYDKDTTGIMVVGVMPDSPALEAGLKPGDIILKVNDLTVNLDTYNKCVDEIKGEEGTKVNLTISRKGEIFEKEVTRKRITANNVESEVLDGNIGYIKILSFDNNIYKQFKSEYDKLMSQNISGLIIDVRDNPGGLVDETIDILDLLLPKGDVLKLVYKDGSQKVYKCEDDEQINIPLAVLTNSRSASASEILSSAIKDSGKGVLIGEKTYGKGIVQEVERLESGGAMSITVAKYYTMSGIEIHKNGITPDIEVELPEDVKNLSVIEKDKDTQLQKAIEYINSKK